VTPGAPRRAGLAARLGLASAAALAGLGLGELALRVADLPKSGPFLQEFYGERFKLMAYDANPSGALDLDLADASLRKTLAGRLADPDEFEASWRDTPFAVSFEFNSQGFREKKLVPKPAGVFRVAVVGDSFTAGHGLPEALAYPRLLEARLQRRAEHGAGAFPLERTVEVLNLGRGNTDLPAIARSADFALRHLAPDVLVYGYFMNDALPDRGAAAASPVHDMLDAGWVAASQSKTRIRIGQSARGPSRIVDLVRRFRADRDVTSATIAWYQGLHEPKAWAATLARIEAMARSARETSARFVLLLLPLPFEIARSPFAAAHAAMASAATGAGIEVVDALPALAAHSDDDLRLHPRDRHPSPLYTRVVAERLAEALGPPGAEAGPGRERSPR